MGEHLSLDLLGAYARRGLSPAELLVADDHLAACNECRARLPGSDPVAAWSSLRVGLAAREPAEHLRYEELAGWVDGSLGDVERELAAAHLEACSRCAAEAAELSGVRGELRAGHEYRPTRRLAAIRAAPRWRIPLQVAAALALVALGLWGFLHQPSHDTARGEPMRSSPSAAAPGVALVDSGRPIRLDPQGHVLGLEAFPAEVQARVASALSSRRVAAADLAELGGRPQQLMGPAAARPPFQLVSPVATVVEAAAPILRWQPLAGASSYRVTVLDRDLVVVAESPDLKDTEWRLPQALERGRTYVWQVAARKAGARMLAPTPPEADARFRVLDAARAEALAAARGRGESQLVLGVLYAEAGLRSEAERELRALNEANPGSPVAQALLDSVTLQLPSPTRTKPAQ